MLPRAHRASEWERGSAAGAGNRRWGARVGEKVRERPSAASGERWAPHRPFGHGSGAVVAAILAFRHAAVPLAVPLLLPLGCRACPPRHARSWSNKQATFPGPPGKRHKVSRNEQDRGPAPSLGCAVMPDDGSRAPVHRAVSGFGRRVAKRDDIGSRCGRCDARVRWSSLAGSLLSQEPECPSTWVDLPRGMCSSLAGWVCQALQSQARTGASSERGPRNTQGQGRAPRTAGREGCLPCAPWAPLRAQSVSMRAVGSAPRAVRASTMLSSDQGG